MARCERLFVYGSLRRGQRFRHLLDALVTACEEGTIRGRMYHYAPSGDTGEYPYLVEGSDTIHGEVLSFSDFRTALRITDVLEEHPRIYRRRVVDVALAGGGCERAWAYFIQPGWERRGRWVAGGDWAAELRRLRRPAAPAQPAQRGVGPARGQVR
jgi:gamma-glutamylcyclotransferase (GGCT)/AIG2-like uncharacterized protein YtfP